MGVSKVEYGENTLVDLTQDTVTPEVLQKGYTAHGADGEPIIGTEEPVLQWENTSNGTYKFEQNGDRWVANNINVSFFAQSSWSVTVPEPTTAYIGYRTTSNNGYLRIGLNGFVLEEYSGIMASESVFELELVEGENTFTATNDSDADANYVILPPIGQQPGQYKYQSKSVTPSSSTQTVYPDTGFDGLYAVTVAEGGSGNAKTGNFNSGEKNSTHYINIGFVPSLLLLYFIRGEHITSYLYISDFSTVKAVEINSGGSSTEYNMSSNSHGIIAVGTTATYVTKNSDIFANKDVYWVAIQ